MSAKPFEGKVAVVTGGASGIGLAVAERFAADGARVVIGDVSREAGEQAAERLGATFVEADLSRRDDCRALIDAAVEKFGTVHILVNNAGFQHIDPIEDFPEDTWDKMLAVMLTAPFLLTRYAWPAMKAQAWGRVVNMASALALVGTPYKVAYVTVKHGMLGLTKTAALEGGAFGIKVNAICPGFVRTPLMEKQIADQARTRNLPPEEVIEKVMLGPTAIKRLIEPAEVANLVAYLCSPAGDTVTGAAWPMDLAWTAS